MPVRAPFRFAFLISLLAAVVPLMGCALYLPELRLRSDLENVEARLVGSFEAADPVVVALPAEFYLTEPNLPSFGERPRSLDFSARTAALAEIFRWMRKGWVGEGRDGRLVIAPAWRDSTGLPPELIKKVRQENAFREQVMQVLVILGRQKGLSPEEVQKHVVRLLQENAPDGTWIQHPVGSWSRKGGRQK